MTANRSNLTPGQRLDAMGQAIFHEHDDPALETPEVWRDIYRAVALDLLKRNDELITVCDKCLTATCWHGVFMCDKAISAGLRKISRRELLALNLEHPSRITNDTSNGR